MAKAPTGPIPAAVPAGVPDQAAVLGRAAGENFTAASRLLLGRHREALLALYGFARLVDELGDSSPGDRLELLDWADAEVERAAVGQARHPVFVALGPVIGAHRLALAPFHDLIEANRRDQSVRRYETFEELTEYCALSANPVGRLVLGVFEAGSEENLARSDAVCTGLQIVEHCQDVMEDAAAGRVYLPGADLAAHGLAADDLVTGTIAPRGPAAHGTPADGRAGRDGVVALAAVVRLETQRARALLEEGTGLAGALRGRARWAVAGFVGGGLAAADALARAGYDVTAGAPRPDRRRRLIRTLGVLGGRA